MRHHKDEIAAILDAFVASGLQIKFEKCKFVQTEISYLGTVLKAPGTISPDPQATEAIKSLEIPSTVRQLRSFLGVLNHKRWFSDPKKLGQYSSKLTSILRGKKTQ